MKRTALCPLMEQVESPESLALTPDQVQAVQARLEQHEQDSASAVPWDQVRTELFQRNH